MEAIALIELDSIAAGFRAADELVKRARVDLLESRPLDPGKYSLVLTYVWKDAHYESAAAAFEVGASKPRHLAVGWDCDDGGPHHLLLAWADATGGKDVILESSSFSSISQPDSASS